jgi:hypothetical protein
MLSQFGIEDNQQFPGTGGKGNFEGLAFGSEGFKEGLYLLVKTPGNISSQIKRVSYLLTAAMTELLSPECTAVPVEWG